MSGWEKIFADAAPEMLDGAIQMGEKLGGPGFQWKVSGYFLNWCLPWYWAALQNALGGSAVRQLMPVFINELQKAIEARAEIDPDFPVEDFRGLVEDIGESYVESIAGDDEGLISSRPQEDEEDVEEEEESIENQIAEVAFNIVRVAFTVGRNQFKPEAAGEASTWIFAMASSSFLRGLEIGMGEEEAMLRRPTFFSRLHHELREQYQEFKNYPLSHFINIAGSIGKQWMQLSTEGDLDETAEE
jgi:hypothetical protein